jgi:hypothetical protein
VYGILAYGVVGVRWGELGFFIVNIKFNNSPMRKKDKNSKVQ